MAAVEEVEWTKPSGKRGSRKGQAPQYPVSVDQAKLDRICNPTALYCNHRLKWINRMNRDPETFPSRDLKLYAEEELGPQIARAKAELSNHPSDWTGADWAKASDRLLKLEAQLSAIEHVLEHRSKLRRYSERSEPPAGSSCEPGPKRFTSIPDTAWDPFSGQ